MTSEWDGQLSFDELAAQLEEPAPAWSDADTAAVAQHLEQSSDAIARDWMAIARSSIGDTAKREARGALDGRRNIPLAVVWARRRRDPRRPLAPRPTIAASVRHAVMADAYRRCGQCRRDGNESSLQLGHILSVVDAWDLMHVLGDSGPWRIASGAAEDLFAQCERCNNGAGGRSQTAESAGAILMRPRGDTLRLRWAVAADVVRYCRLVEQLEAGEEPAR